MPIGFDSWKIRLSTCVAVSVEPDFWTYQPADLALRGPVDAQCANVCWRLRGGWENLVDNTARPDVAIGYTLLDQVVGVGACFRTLTTLLGDSGPAAR